MCKIKVTSTLVESIRFPDNPWIFVFDLFSSSTLVKTVYRVLLVLF